MKNPVWGVFECQCVYAHVCMCVREYKVMRDGRERGKGREGANDGIRWANYTGRFSTLVITSSLSSIPSLNHHPPLPLLKAVRAVTNQRSKRP